ncbi:alginate O-acetyltransferase AlgF [Paraburkholderia madseniana]|uniref:Alginate O-acetyltransferase AlgF n=1 Tax=Paraburkholderia madseniana TaxID=2599607 RepID=A0AAP5BMC7_9BURK|nr:MULTISPECIES: alginate O-acetyltransferase AlgF [Paraburkholderia]MCX4151211.1 alginate O-acetyltransferase AlgF [Paraburkholderia madseniana]MDN7154143.1 alginate O-acetyltransferase AlgF [Paraburkholderia sp. WS6]MDQ6413025.1 alginate O-acetyltransferase AlgF [Paraburkholderia madseniana]
MKRDRLGKSKVAAVMAAAVASAALLSAGVAYAAADDVASLYGPQPPANASYLRVLNASSQAVRVALAGSEAPQTLAPGAVTRFSVLTEGTSARVTVDGKALADAAGSGNATANATTRAGDAVTVALRHDAKGWHATRIAGRYERVDGLKATLRAFNFAPGCSAKIGVDGNGPTVFAQVAAGAQDARSINPVSAKLVGQCGAVASAVLPLPALAAGDSYSLFVTGDAAKPVLSGARDALAWPPAAN